MEESNDNQSGRLGPKKKYAVMYGYCGTGYHGSQTNQNTETIDDDLILGMYKAGCISDQNYNDEKRFTKNGWNRAARTDKGVHAAGNVVSTKLVVIPGEERETVERINACLPEGIRVYKIVKTSKAFNAKNFCDRRQYEYLLPVYCLKPYNEELSCLTVEEDIKQNWREYVENEEFKEMCKALPSTPNPFAEGPDNVQHIKSLATSLALLASYSSLNQYTEDALDKSFGGCLQKDSWPPYLQNALQTLRVCMSLFVGTHNFHNYTIGKNAADASALRHILQISVSDPISIHQELYVRIRLEGQSFMMHQIRKMIGVSIEVARGRCSLYQVYCSLSRGNMITPLAPSTGLFLDKTLFSEYNKKQGDDAGKRIDFEDEEIAEARCSFRHRMIYEHIDEQIKEENVFHAWLASNDSFCNEYIVSYPTKEEISAMETEARVNNRKKKEEKKEKWDRNKKFVKSEENECSICCKLHPSFIFMTLLFCDPFT